MNVNELLQSLNFNGVVHEIDYDNIVILNVGDSYFTCLRAYVSSDGIIEDTDYDGWYIPCVSVYTKEGQLLNDTYTFLEKESENWIINQYDSS